MQVAYDLTADHTAAGAVGVSYCLAGSLCLAIVPVQYNALQRVGDTCHHTIVPVSR